MEGEGFVVLVWHINRTQSKRDKEEEEEEARSLLYLRLLSNKYSGLMVKDLPDLGYTTVLVALFKSNCFSPRSGRILTPLVTKTPRDELSTTTHSFSPDARCTYIQAAARLVVPSIEVGVK